MCFISIRVSRYPCRCSRRAGSQGIPTGELRPSRAVEYGAVETRARQYRLSVTAFVHTLSVQAVRQVSIVSHSPHRGVTL